MPIELASLAKGACRLHHSINTHLRPGQGCGIAFADQLAASTRGDQFVTIQHERLAKRPHDRVVVQQITQGGVVKQVVDHHNLYIGVVLEDAEYRAAYPAKAIDCYTHHTASSVWSSAAYRRATSSRRAA